MLFMMENSNNLPFDQMNIVHGEEMELANSIYNFLKSSPTGNEKRSEELNQMLKIFIIHVKEHFQYEEELMEETNCPILSCHKEEHQKTLSEMIEVFREYFTTKNEQLLLAYFEYNFKVWIIDHIASMDYLTAVFFDKYQRGEEVPTGGCSGHSKQTCS